MDYLILFYVLFSTIPGIYLASKKYFYVIPNQKYNIFLFKLIFSVPALTCLILVSSLPILLFWELQPNFSSYLIEIFGRYIILGIPILLDIITILFFEKYCIRKDIPFEYQPDFMKHELYVFMPIQKIIGGSYYKTKFTYSKKREPKELLIGIQAENLTMDFKILEGYDVVYTNTGEIVVSEKALKIFHANNLSGFYTQPVKDYRKPPIESKKIFSQLFSQSILPKMAAETEICITNVLQLKVCVRNDLIYYDKTTLENASDFNRSLEVLGSHEGIPYAPQHLWIVTNKAMKVLINELNQRKRDFIPVNLVDDEK
jgi:hypothetical protein